MMSKAPRMSAIAGALFLAGLALCGPTGCGKFFPPLNQCTTDCSTPGTNYIYVANATTATPSIAGFSITSSTSTNNGTQTTKTTLNETPNSAYSLGFVPGAMAISPTNPWLYVAANGQAGIFLYAVNSDGSITQQNNNSAVATDIAATMQVDSTGQWLIVGDFSTSLTQAPMVVYAIDTTTGLLTSKGTLNVSKPGAMSQITIALNSSLGTSMSNVFATLKTGGFEFLTFDASSGILTDVGNVATPGPAYADVGVAVDPTSKYAFVTETGGTGLKVYNVPSTGTAVPTAIGSPYATATGPGAVVVDSTGSYVYVANSSSNSISAFALVAGNGTLTAITGSPFTTGNTPIAMVEDSTKKYLAVACNGGNSDLEVYTFDASAGKLDAAAQATTGTDPVSPFSIVAR